MARLFSGQAVKANGSYDATVDPGKMYACEVFYPSGVTATVTAFQKAPDGVTYQAVTWGSDPTTGTAVSIAATGTDRSFQVRAVSDTLRLTVASLSGGWIYPVVVEVPHGR